MLSQRVAAAGCNLSAEVDQETNRQLLSLSSAEFWKILDALRFGNIDINIKGEETDDDVLAALQATKTQWLEFEELNNRLTSGIVSKADAELIDTKNLALLSSAQELVKTVLASYSNSSGEQTGFGNAIDIAGRQRMLTQKMSKEACQIPWNFSKVR